MNKKISTLLVGAMLATVGVGSVSAQSTKLDKVDGTYNQKLYQITVGAQGDSVIVMTKRADGADSLYVKNRATLGADSLANSLWCVAMTKPAQAGQHPIYDFRNKATGKKLAIDINPDWIKNTASGDTLAVGVDLDGWAFSESFPTLSDKRPLYTYIPGQDSVVALVWDQTGAKGGLQAMKTAAVTDSIKKYVTDAGYVFTLKTPDHLTLNAHALHTMFGSNLDGKSVKFSFWKKIGGKEVELKNTPAKEQIVGNVFDQELIAHDTAFAGVAYKGVYFTTKKGTYLRVDTAWHNGDGIRFNVLTDTTTQAAWDADIAAGRNMGHYFFQINYAPASDSVYMRVDTAIYNVSLGNGYFDTPAHGADSTYVVLQNLTENQKWALTVGKDSIATRIALGFGTCGEEAGLGRTSVKDGLYTIKDKTSGKYFAYPLYGNGDVLDWVEFDEESQLAAHMPAYQWIIDRTYDTGDLAETSPITIENREYENKFTVQLYKDEDGKIFARSSELAGANLEIVEISKDDYPEAYTDKYLGYYHRPAADIEYNVNKYVFRYFHPYALDDDARYLTIDNDSLLYAKENRKGVNFELQSYENKEHNYGVAHTIAGGDITKKAYKESIYGKIGIVPLKRTAYIIAREGAVMDSIADKKYAMAQRKYLTEVDSFYMKANNYYGEDDFFTIIKANNDAPAWSKAGVSDNNLNSPIGVQELSTERSSAFSIKYDDTPLYRRFNNANIGEEEIGRDSLKFREFYRGEYLMDETNTNFLNENVNYLGIWTADKAKGKLAFRVDTAWVVRGLGYIKPQYLISVSNSFYEGKVAEDCQEDGVHIDRETLEVTDDASKCIHAHMAVPSFWRGKYLVSFADSVAKYNGKDAALPYLDKVGAYTRVGFVDAIHKGDSLYILPAAYRNVKNEDIKFAELEKLNGELKADFPAVVDENTEYPFIINLKGNEHKNVTWSFRYVYPDEALSVEKEGKENSFLIESNSYPEKDGKYDATNGTKLDIAPNCAAWLKNQNGCLVLTNERSSFEDAVTGGDPALIFNIDRKTADDDYATDNEEIATSEVTVIAQEGTVRIANAEGKKVVITNVLGQVVANTVITSSDVVIAAPAGVVVVAIEGEEAVKAIVK
ncbi:MAG: hypothetical protein J6K31_11275 [Parabacteroides sp.]|nr:hypothetical protein [Parabacteroides sp.]